jgi:primosomal protein N'
VSASRAVRIITEVAAVDRPFDYAVTDATSQVAPGDRVRVDFKNRSVRGWVIGDVQGDRELKPLTKWLGYGPPPALLELLEWASQRWCSPLSRFLISTTPKRLVTTLPAPAPKTPLSAGIAATAVVQRPGVIQLAPTSDPLALILGAYVDSLGRDGSLLVLVPTEAWAVRMRGRLEQRGCHVASGEGDWDRMRAGWPVVVGPRGTALAPVPRVAGAVVIDADDEAYRSQSAPTWDAVTMLRERCAIDNAPLWCTSMIPSPTLLARGIYDKDADLVGGWPRIEVVDRRLCDPRDGVLSGSALDVAHRALGGTEPVAVCVVLQRLGTGRLFACKKCGELARCGVCAQGEQEVGAQLSCREHHEMRANFCRSCGATNLKRVRVGVTTLARDVAAQLSQPVSEVTAASDRQAPLARVVVGTEAIWQRVRRCGVVIFVDFDQYLLAPRESARRAAVMAVGKAGRLVGSRREARGEVILQTRRSDDQVITALREADLDAIIDDDRANAKLLELSPYAAIAKVTGPAAGAFVAQLVGSGLSTFEAPDGYVVRAPDVVALTSILRATARPPGKLRIAVE